MYYSLLKSNTVGASAIFLNEGIDTGDIVCTKEYKAAFNLELLDLVFDPLIRADVLISLKKLKSNSYKVNQQKIMQEKIILLFIQY